MLDNVWTSNETICLLTDSADGRDKGFGIYFQGNWAQGCWPKEWADNGILADITFILPGICSAFNMILYCKDSKTRFLTRVITLLDFEDFLLIIATTG
jgi:hypothetical protein